MKKIKKNIINYGKQRILKEMESLLTKDVMRFILKKNTEEESKNEKESCADTRSGDGNWCHYGLWKKS